MANIKVLFWFDVEDYVTPESEEAFLGLLNLCEERRIPGVFKLVGEKARILEAHNRTDILDKLKKHEVGYHTDYHSVHPTISEYLEHMGFKEGAEQFDREEYRGLRDVERITGMPVTCYGQPGGSWAPQTFPAILKWGVPVYLDNHEQVTLNSRPYWYGGLLNFMELTGFMRMELEEGGLEAAKRQFDDIYEKLSQESVGFVSIVYHPNEFSTTQFWDDVNFSKGKNPPREQWKPAALRPPGEMQHYLNMLGQFLDYTLSKDNVEYITSVQARELERSAQGELTREQVRQIAANVGDDLYFQLYEGYSLSASDLHSLFCGYLLGKPLKPELIYGPESEATSDEIHSVKVKDLKQAVSQAYPNVFGHKQLPAAFDVGSGQINAVDLTCTLAKVIRDELTDEDEEVPVIRGYLRSQIHAKDEDHWGKGWIIFPEDFRAPNIVRMSKLQSWTLKPALF